MNLAGVASGATRAALTQHFALQENAADISAKVLLFTVHDSETVKYLVVYWICFYLFEGRKPRDYGNDDGNVIGNVACSVYLWQPFSHLVLVSLPHCVSHVW